ncbi:MAG: hypothetical protein MJZ34_07320 [Paludibacteraceae bacterium]|nr:hypothetical protein [Paludibacteraceae bacterium]
MSENKEDDVVRCAKLRTNRIELLKKLVQDKPDEYDANKLQEAIDFVNNLNDDVIDATLILQNDVNIIQKPIYKFTEEELEKIRSMMSSLGYVNEVENVHNEEAQRSDYMSRWGKDIDGKHLCRVVCLSRMRPFLGNKEYNILSVNYCFPNDSYSNIDDLINATKNLILKLDNDIW